MPKYGEASKNRIAKKAYFLRLFATVKGRPKKNRLEAAWVEDRERWVVIVPSSWTGRRAYKYFIDKTNADIWITEREMERAKGMEIQLRDRPQDIVKTISRAAPVYLKEQHGKSGHDTALNHLKKLMGQFGGLELDELRPMPVRKWLLGLECSERTRWGVYSTCRTFARWANRYGFASSNVFEAIDSPEKGDAPKAILSVEEMLTLLDSETMKAGLHAPMPEYMRAWVVLGGFAGIRSEEILKMTWRCLDFKSLEIHVPPLAIKKTRGGLRERYVTMLPAFIRHCPVVPTERLDEKIIPVSRTTFHYHATRMAAVLGYEKWPKNCLRHSFASYHLAEWGDAGKTAHQLGHTSTAMVHQNYARAVKKNEAEAWWAIGLPEDPVAPGKVTDLPKAA